MKIGQLITRVADLLEAEGRQLRESSVEVGLAITFALAASVIGVGGIGLVAWGLFEALRQGVGVVGAALISGAFLVGCAGGLVWTALRIARGR